MARGCHGRFRKLKIKNWKETTKDRKTWRDRLRGRKLGETG
jgi:hypothetical protein